MHDLIITMYHESVYHWTLVAPGSGAPGVRMSLDVLKEILAGIATGTYRIDAQDFRCFLRAIGWD